MSLSVSISILISAAALVALFVTVFEIINNQRERKKRYKIAQRPSPLPSSSDSPRRPRNESLSSSLSAHDSSEHTLPTSPNKMSDSNPSTTKINVHSSCKTNKRRLQRKSKKAAEKSVENHIHDELHKRFASSNEYVTESSSNSQCDLLPKTRKDLINQTKNGSSIYSSHNTKKRRCQRKSKKAAEKSAQNYNDYICFPNSNERGIDSSPETRTNYKSFNQTTLEENVHNSNKTFKRRCQRKSKMAAVKVAQKYSNNYKCFSDSNEFGLESSSDSSSKIQEKLINQTIHEENIYNSNKAYKRRHQRKSKMAVEKSAQNYINSYIYSSEYEMESNSDLPLKTRDKVKVCNLNKTNKRRYQRKSKKAAEKLAQNLDDNNLYQCISDSNDCEIESSSDLQSDSPSKTQDKLVNQTIFKENIYNSSKTNKRTCQRKSKIAAEKSAQNLINNKLQKCASNSNDCESQSSSDSPPKNLDELVSQTIFDDNHLSNKTKQRCQRKSKIAAEKSAQNLINNKLQKCASNSNDCESQSSSDSPLKTLDELVSQTIFDDNHLSNKTNKRKCQRKSRMAAEKSARNYINNELYESVRGSNVHKSESSSDSPSKILDELVNQTRFEDTVHISNSNKTNKRKCQRKSKMAAEKSARNYINNELYESVLDSNVHNKSESSSDSQFDLLPKTIDKSIYQTIFEENEANKKRHKRKSEEKAENLAQNHHHNNKHEGYAEEYEFQSSESDLLQKIGNKLIVMSKEDNCKKKTHEACKRDLYDNENNPVTSNVCLSKKIEEEKLGQFNFCKACEEKQINTYAYPCHHFFLCVDCSVKIFRIYKKCTICHEDVIEFVQFLS